MKDSAYTLMFAAVLGIACAAMLTAVGQTTKQRYQRNREADKRRSILAALEPTYDTAASADKVLDDFKRMIPDGREELGDLTVYRYLLAGKLQAVAVFFEGDEEADGLWSHIEGYLILEPDLTTIRGLAITEQEETPGLGGDIAAGSFLDQWKGKKIVSADGKVGIVIKTGAGATAINHVDGITGATLTSKAVEHMVNKVIAIIVKERDKNGH